MLISCLPALSNAQTPPSDSLRIVTADSIPPEEEGSLGEIVTYSAQDSVVALPGEGKALLYGKAKVDYGSSMSMEAEYIEIDYKRNTISAYGNKDSLGAPVGTPVFRTGQEDPIEAEKIIYNLKTKKGKIYNALTRQGEFLVFGNQIKKDSNNVVYFSEMKCIPCDQSDARTVFRATKAKVIPDDKIVTGPMFLEIGGVPTPLGLPFGYFPNTKKQHNGIILPAFGNSPNFGLNLTRGGYYLGISDQTDMVLLGDIYANGSFALSAQNNYNVLYRANGYTYLGFKQFNNGDRDIPAQFSTNRAYEVRWLHNQDNKSNPSIRFSANVNFVNNQQFNRLNAINTGDFLQNTFQSNINFTKSFRKSSLSLNAMHSQNSLTRDVQITLPSLTYNVNRFFPFKRERAVRQNVFDKIGISYIAEAQNLVRGKENTIFQNFHPDSMRYGLRQSLPISTNFNILKYITATPMLNLSSSAVTRRTNKEYFRTTRGTDSIATNTSRDMIATIDGRFSTDLNTKVYFDYIFKRSKLQQIRHLMIPTIGYAYRPDFGSPQFGYYKSVQRDSLGNFNRYSVMENALYPAPSPNEESAIHFGLTNVVDAKVKQKNDTGVVFVKKAIIQQLAINGSYNFAADSMKLSKIGMSGRTVLFKYIDLNAGASFSPYQLQKRYEQALDRTFYYETSSYLYKTDGRPLRFEQASLALSTNIGSEMANAILKARQDHDLTNGAEPGGRKESQSNSSMPWNFTVRYNLTILNPYDERIIPDHQLQLAADVMPTKFWKLGVTSGYDFKTGRLTYTKFNIYRDLKCWEAAIEWIPFGIQKRYMLTLNLKSSMLRDFKIPRQRQWFDTFQ